MPELPPTRNGAELTDDALCGSFRVYQRRRGHRYSLDDVLTAWVAANAHPQASRVLDLGTGIGSVLLMLAYKLPSARLCGVEAQAQSYALLERNVERNGVAARVRLCHADLRIAGLLEALCDRGARFDLVTGTPPYKAPGQGPISPDPQRAYARVELRGGVEAYLEAAARVLSTDGKVVICASAERPERVEIGAREAGLSLLERTDAVPIAGRKSALFSVYVLAHGPRTDASRRRPDFVARDETGRRSAAALAVRRFFDLETRADEAPSPPVRRRSQPTVER